MENSPQIKTDKARENSMAYKSIDYSGFIERLFARGVDFAITVGVGYLVYRWKGLSAALLWALAFDICSRIILTFFLGATIGKLLFGVRVISRNSGKLTIWQVIIRESAKCISGVFLNFGYLSIMVNRRKKAWHDMIACTAVTSGGREEARYGREVYKERPEKWYVAFAAPITAVFTGVMIFGVVKASGYVLNDIGMIGFLHVNDTLPVEFQYKIPPQSLGTAALNKSIIQLGDTDGDGGYEIFKEGIKDDKTVINNLKFLGGKPADGESTVVCEKLVIQYRLLDINLDKKDEVAALFEDKTIKLYSMDGTSKEIASFGPLEFKDIASVFKGRDGTNLPYSLYIMGDKNKLSVLNIKEGKMESREFSLEGAYNFISADIGVFNGKSYITAVSDDQKLVFYEFNGSTYQRSKEMALPVKGRVSIAVKDINADGKNEVVVMSPSNSERTYCVFAAYDVSGDSMKKIWDAGKSYKHDESKVSFALSDGMDVDKDKRFEAYLVSQNASGRTGLYIFESDKYLFKVNDILRTFSLTK